MSIFGTDHPLDEVAAYAVGALDDVESSLVEAHLATCATCRAELVAHHDVLARLTADEPAPPALWDRIVASLPADAGPATSRPADTARPAPPAAAGPAGPVAPAGGEAPRPRPAPPVGPPQAGTGEPARSPEPARDRRSDDRTRPSGGSPAHLARPPRRRRAGRLLQAAAALVVVAGLAVGATLALTQDDDGPSGEVANPPPTAPAPLTDVDDLAEAALDDPTSLAVLAGEDLVPRARLVSADTGTYVVLDELPPLPTGRAYQLWSVDGTAPVSLGVLGNGEQTAIAVAVPEGTATVAISDAPAAGEVSPTGPIVASGPVQPA